MQAASTSARRARIHHRQSLHTLTYVILDEANGGIIRNVNHEGIAVLAVSPVPLRRRVRVRFELRHPRTRVDAMGEIVWADTSGQCGIRFLDLSAEGVRQINEWILGDLLETLPSRSNAIFSWASTTNAETGAAETACDITPGEGDGLRLSSGARDVIQLQPKEARSESISEPVCLPRINPASLELPSFSPASFDPALPAAAASPVGWLVSSGKRVTWALNFLIVFAALLLYGLIFLAVAQEFPRWPLGLEAIFGGVVFVIAFYCLFFRAFGGSSMGARLARLAELADGESDDDATRFR